MLQGVHAPAMGLVSVFAPVSSAIPGQSVAFDCLTVRRFVRWAWAGSCTAGVRFRMHWHSDRTGVCQRRVHPDARRCFGQCGERHDDGRPEGKPGRRRRGGHGAGQLLTVLLKNKRQFERVVTHLHGSGPGARYIGSQYHASENHAKYPSGQKNSSSHASNSTALVSVTLVWSLA